MEWYFFAFVSAILVSIVSILNKKILTHEHALEFSASRGILVFILSLFLIPFVNFNMPWNIYLFIYLVSLMVSAGMIFYFKGMRHGDLSEVAPLMNISPLFLLIIAFFVLGENPTSKQYFGVFLLILGAYSLEVGVANKGFLEPIRMFLKSKVIHNLLFAMIIFSIGATFDKLIITKHTDFLTYFFLFSVFKTFNFIFLETYNNGFSEIVKDLRKDFKILFIDAIVGFFAHLFYLIAVSMPTAAISLIIPIKRTSNLFTTILGGKLFHEQNLLVKILACIIMIWGVVFVLL